MWPIFVLAALSAHPSPPTVVIESSDGCRSATCADQPRITGTSRSAESTNFQIHCHAGSCDARKLAESCEAWRSHLRKHWLGKADTEAWSPRCVVVGHSHRATNLAAVGRGGQQSFGSTWIDTERGRSISGRRIDLLTDQRGTITALGHELTHVVIADAFDGRQPPTWANEGIALLSDSTDKQSHHERDAATAVRSRVAFRCLELMTIDQYPSPDRIPAFYGQSASLVRMLCQRGQPHEFLNFLKQSEELGYDRALEQSYGISGSIELQRLWDEFFAQSQRSSAEAQKVAVKLAN